MYSSSLNAELIQRLTTDPAIQFKRKGNELRDGVCPNCGHRELFIKIDKPYKVQCRRFNNCNYNETVRNLYPDLFENFSKRYPASDANPNATADAYMKENRGFDLKVVSGMYTQGWKKLSNGKFAATVKVPLFGKDTWERLIDADMVRANGGKKAYISFGTDFAGRAWIAPEMKIETGDTVFITEGIFKSMALLHKNHKSISALSCSNLPSKVINDHKGKYIVWVIALDNDKAGLMYAAKYRKEIIRMNEKCLVAIPEEGEDWDDVYRAGRLDEQYIQDSLWRGYHLLAESAEEKAFFFWLKRRQNYHLFTHFNSLWKYKADPKERDAEKITTPLKPNWFEDHEFGKDIATFHGFSKIERISNCIPQFMYIELDALTEEQFYNFRFSFQNGTGDLQTTFDGSAMESPSSFNKMLLTKTPGGSFDGSATDLKVLRERWFDNKPTYVTTLPFCGYDRDSQTYVFPEFGYLKGQFLEVNKDGFMTCGKKFLKCGLKSMEIKRPDPDAGLDWISDFQDAFSLNGMVLMSWWLGTLFAEQIRDKQYSWPFLEYTGDQGAGKSTQIEFMWRCCGRDNYEGFDPSKSTHAGRARNFQQVANLPCVLLEGDRSGDDRGARKGGFDMDELKTAYNGRGIRAMGIKKRGAETDEPPFRGGILISQNASVDGSDALLSRIVHCHCTREHFTPATEKKARHLSGLSISDLAVWMDVALRNEGKLLEGYFKKQTEIEQAWKEKHNGIQNRLILNHSQVAAWAWQLPTIFGNAVSRAMCQQIEDHIIRRCTDRQSRLSADHPLVQLFWEQYEYLHIQHTSNGMQEVLNESKDSGQIAIRLPHFQEVANNHNMERLPMVDLKRLLPTCRSHRFIGQRKIRKDAEILHCWVFEDKKENEN